MVSQPKDQAKPSEQQGDLLGTLKDIQEEFLQITELASMEKNYTRELSNLLKQVLVVLRTSVPISPEVFKMQVKDAALSSEGNVLVIQDDGLISSKSLEEFDSETAVKVVADGLPKLRLAATNHRKKIGARVNVLEEVIRELRKLVRALGEGKREGKAEKPEEAVEDIVKSALTRK